MAIIPRSVERVIEEFSRLPGIGPRTAERLTFYLLRSEPASASDLGAAIATLRDQVQTCTTCYNISDELTCQICGDPNRQRQLIAVVEEPLDVVAVEKTGQFRGLYHVLGGVISPIDGIGPDQLQIAPLLKRVADGQIKEIILATNPNTESETTAMYIRQQLEPHQVLVTRLARGLPVGGDLEYADQITLGRALQGRQSF